MVLKRQTRVLLVVLLAFAIFGLCGAIWLLRTRPIWGSTERAWICRLCAVQRSERFRLVIGVRGSTKTNTTTSTPIAKILKMETPCDHRWFWFHEELDEVRLNPLPVGRTAWTRGMPVGVTDARSFELALESIATTNTTVARDRWHAVISGIERRSPEIDELRNMLSTLTPLPKITEFLLSIEAPTADRSAP